MENQNILEVHGLCKKYKKFALEQVDLVLPKGCIMGFVGENGAGKTTTLKCILDIAHRDSGSVDIFGQDSRKAGGAGPVRTWSRRDSQQKGNRKKADGERQKAVPP